MGELKALREECKREGAKAKQKGEKKAIMEKYRQLEEEMLQRHKAELSSVPPAEETVAPADETVPDDVVAAPTVIQEPVISKAQKKRERRAEKERLFREERDADLVGVVPMSVIENQQLQEQFRKAGLKIHEIASDGNCLYHAVAHQVRLQKNDTPSQQGLRNTCADYVQNHIDDFRGFVDGDDETLDSYIASIRKDGTFGGDLELAALSQALQCCICVHQASDMPVVEFGSQFEGTPLQLSFHRHLQTDAHYQSLVPA